MNHPKTRRQFLREVGSGMLIASVGSEVAFDLGLADACAASGGGGDALAFGGIEPLVALMQETPVDRLLPALRARLESGDGLDRLVAAAALANARTFGGEDYVGFHTMMALAPALHMARELPDPLRPLPVFKVLYRNTNRIHEHGGRSGEVLSVVDPAPLPEGRDGADLLGDAVHRRDAPEAEATLAALVARSPGEALDDLLHTVQECPEVHRVVLPYRAWELLGVVGSEHALTLLRQSVRYCVRNEEWAAKAPRNAPRTLLPELLERYGLLGAKPGDRKLDDEAVDRMSVLFFSSRPEDAAAAAAAALAEGVSPASVGEAVSLAANQLVLRDHGRPPSQEVPGKPIGSVHGDSIGVHASDSANAWRNLARVSGTRNTFACLILGAWQVAHDRSDRGGDFLHWEPLPIQWHLDGIKSTEPAALLDELDEAVRGNLQGRATAVVARYGALGHPARAVLDRLLRFAVSEDGALHAEKYYRTCCEEFWATRPAFQWRHLESLARVTASEFGRPAPGMDEAREVLGV